MQVKVSRTVAFPPEAVFAVVADPEAWPCGGPVEHLAGSGVGARYQITQRIGPHAVVATLTVTAMEVPHRLAWRSVHEAFEHRAELRFVPRRVGTLIIAIDRDLWHHAPWWVGWTGRAAMRRDMQRRLAAIEAAVEGRAATVEEGAATVEGRAEAHPQWKEREEDRLGPS